MGGNARTSDLELIFIHQGQYERNHPVSDTEKNTAGKPAADDKSSARKDPFHLEGTKTFGIAAEFPVEMHDPQCCSRFGARVFFETDDLSAWIEYRHDSGCEVWRFLP